MRAIAILSLLSLAVPAAAQTNATWWGHAAWIITTPGGAALAVDPWLKNPTAPKDAAWPTKLDAILVTHGHGDHVGDAVELASKTGALLVGSFELTGILGAKNSWGGNMGGQVQVKDATIHLVEAAHSSGYSADGKAPTYAGPAMGYVIEVAKGPRIYHAGDTDAFASMALIADRYAPTVALLPIGGHFTMDPTGAAFAAGLLRVQKVVPMHFGTFPLLAGTPQQLRDAVKARQLKTEVVEAKPGQTLSL